MPEIIRVKNVKAFIPDEDKIRIESNASQIVLYSLVLLTVLGLNDLANNMISQYGGKIVKNRVIYVLLLLSLTLFLAYWLGTNINLLK